MMVATYVAAGDERTMRVASAFDWNGVLAPANIRVDAWVTPPIYTGKPPIILSAANKESRAADSGPLPVPAGSTLIVRSSGGTLDVVAGGGVTEVRPPSRRPRAPTSGISQITGDGTVHVRAPVRPAAVEIHRDARSPADHFAGEGSRAAGPRLAADVLQDRGRLRRHRSPRAIRRAPASGQGIRQGAPERMRRPPSRGRCSSRRSFRWCCRMRAPATASARP